MIDTTSKILRGQDAVDAARTLANRDIGPPEAHQHGDTEVLFFAPGKGEDYTKRLDVIWKMVASGIIEDRHGKAADQFHHHFNIAKLGDYYASVNMFRIQGGRPKFTEKQMHHRAEVKKALAWLGKGMEASLVYHVAGLRKSVLSWCSERIGGMHNQVATGILLAGQDRLSDGYGISA